jgi:outer membrane protein assembly factor BamB
MMLCRRRFSLGSGSFLIFFNLFSITSATDGQILCSPNYAIVEVSKKIIVGSYDFSLYCINDATGQQEWIQH